MATVAADLVVLKAKAQAAGAYVHANYKQLGTAVVLGKFSGVLVGLLLKLI